MLFGFAHPASAWSLPLLQHPTDDHIQLATINVHFAISSSVLGFDSTPQSAIKTVSIQNADSAVQITQMHKATPAAVIGQPQETKSQTPTAVSTAAKQQTAKSPSKVMQDNLPSKSINLQMTEKQQIGTAPSTPKPPVAQSQKLVEKEKTSDGDFQSIDVKKITDESKIEVELQLKDQSGTVKIDRETFQKVKTSLKVLKEIPDDQLFEASVIAGSVTEMVRSTLAFPLGTVKARVQSRRSMSVGRRRNRTLLRKLKVTWLTFVYETKRGNLYAGILPTLLITIPASGVYSGVKEVSRRAIAMGMQSQFVASIFNDNSELTSYVKVLSVNLLSVLIADVASLAVRTPADVLALRRQVFGRSNVRSDYTDWVKDSALLLPAMIITDLPYLVSRILLNAAISTSGENLGRYELETIAIACLCAFLTTPFDVARTRILLPTLPSDEVTERRIAGSSKYRKERRQKLSVLPTMRRISKEGNGGVQNLFAGWLERTVFLGLGRAWLDPIRVIGYLGLRDAILLKFD
ncbi:hypothetical protein ACHAWO_001521 [Cyclotella atomus]|uniref:Uncharacterized protein n=1 Tax=Cyclotella atomus TaxID=382360 RepID=A0ABD3MYY9_9STRA